jgi:hypothetical protein
VALRDEEGCWSLLAAAVYDQKFAVRIMAAFVPPNEQKTLQVTSDYCLGEVWVPY